MDRTYFMHILFSSLQSLSELKTEVWNLLLFLEKIPTNKRKSLTKCLLEDEVLKSSPYSHPSFRNVVAQPQEGDGESEEVMMASLQGFWEEFNQQCKPERTSQLLTRQSPHVI